MSVKSIFSTILGTIATIIISCLIIELLNVELQSIQINRLINLSGSQSAALFAQETYKTDSGKAGSASMEDIRNADGGSYVSGKFYGGNTTESAVYNHIYGSSASEFRSWATSPNIAGKWLSVDCISGVKSDGMYGKSGEMYRANYVTPLNMGVPYMDKEVLTKMFQWNLASLLSNCNYKAIDTDVNGQYCVHFNGYRVYASMAQITNLEYKVFDLTNTADAQEFYSLTSINPSGLNGSISTTVGTYTPNTANMDTASGYGDERQYACVIGIEYSVPISYEGVTPMRAIVEYLWHNDASRVEGLNGNIPDRGNAEWNNNIHVYKGGGFPSSDNTGAVPNSLIYYIIR